MSAIETFSFSGFTLRPATYLDRQLAQAWTFADPYHKDVSPDFWIEQRIGRDSYLLTDAKGPVFFFKLERLTGTRVMCHIQFMPEVELDTRDRTRSGLMLGLHWIQKVLEINGVKSLEFDGDNPGLIRFAKRRLGFTGEGKRLVKAIGR